MEKSASVKPEKRLVVKYFILEYVSVAVMGAAILLSAGRWNWLPAWVVIALMTVCLTGVGIVLLRYQPGLMIERMSPPKSSKKWDSILISILRLVQLARYVLGGLDQRFGWSEGFSTGLQIAAAVLCLAGYGLFAWAMASNPFFSQVVRIQSDRGHAVETSGPYRFVRHPSYAGMIVFEIGMGILLDSWWALLAGAVCVAIFILRTALEDATLRRELPGYADYAKKTRKRLLPGIW